MFISANDEMAGPGHKPANPQPAPNKTAPMISLLSKSFFWGIEKLSANKGFCFLKIKINGVVTTKAPIITKAREGSQSPNKFKKPKTFAGLIISEIVRPIPNIIPAIKEVTLLILN